MEHKTGEHTAKNLQLVMFNELTPDGTMPPVFNLF